LTDAITTQDAQNTPTRCMNNCAAGNYTFAAGKMIVVPASGCLLTVRIIQLRMAARVSVERVSTDRTLTWVKTINATELGASFVFQACNPDQEFAALLWE
jgi:hypothetical protein